jgi:hypothetical protein
LASNPVSHARTKHIKVDVHFIREKVTNRDIQLCYLSTLGQVADLFTKGLTIDRFFLLRDTLPIVPPINQITHTPYSANSATIPAKIQVIDSRPYQEKSAVIQGPSLAETIDSKQEGHDCILTPYQPYLSHNFVTCHIHSTLYFNYKSIYNTNP